MYNISYNKLLLLYNIRHVYHNIIICHMHTILDSYCDAGCWILDNIETPETFPASTLARVSEL